MRADRFTNKVAFVTGAGQGMGQQFALDLAAEGAKVVISDISVPALEETEGMLKEKGADFLSLVCDVSQYDQVEAAFEKTVAKYGRVDILINNAGILKSATIEDTSLELIDLTIDVNIKGVLYCIRKGGHALHEEAGLWEDRQPRLDHREKRRQQHDVCVWRFQGRRHHADQIRCQAAGALRNHLQRAGAPRRHDEDDGVLG